MFDARIEIERMVVVVGEMRRAMNVPTLLLSEWVEGWIGEKAHKRHRTGIVCIVTGVCWGTC